MQLLSQGRIVENTFRDVGDDEAVPGEGDVYVSLDRFERDGPWERTGRLGVRAEGHVELDRLAAVLPSVDSIALELPKFTDGRAYSTARLLRERLGWKGELRAAGNVLRDQLFYLSRCGFDAFELADRVTAEGARRALGEVSVTYQPAVDERLPLWRRRSPAVVQECQAHAKGEP